MYQRALAGYEKPSPVDTQQGPQSREIGAPRGRRSRDIVDISSLSAARRLGMCQAWLGAHSQWKMSVGCCPGSYADSCLRAQQLNCPRL